MKHPDIINLEDLFRKQPAAKPRLASPARILAPGQIWEIAAVEKDLFQEVVLLGDVKNEFGISFVDVAPLVHDATMAGPQDYILPERVLCHNAVVMQSLSFSLSTENLASPIGALEDAIVQELLAHYAESQDGALTKSERHAPDYFDAQDIRYQFHEDAAGQILELQACLYRVLDELDAVSPLQVLDATSDFNRLIPAFAMAAAGEGRPDHLEAIELTFELDGKPARVTIRQSVKQGHLAVVVDGDPHGRCAKVLTTSGRQLAAIRHGEARFEWSGDIGNALVVADESGSPIVKIMIQ